ncbi:hypothetical protein LTR53_013190 [Teratosphaeriaceae sp. CCFEE 6253]|nr:hypothetical protein LTR53_013190 [Teratosphaeriaceae sp. CCFEE 6253]
MERAYGERCSSWFLLSATQGGVCQECSSEASLSSEPLIPPPPPPPTPTPSPDGRGPYGTTRKCGSCRGAFLSIGGGETRLAMMHKASVSERETRHSPTAAMQIKIETLTTCADDKTPDFLASQAGNPFMPQDNGIGLQLGNAFPPPEEIQPRSAGGSSISGSISGSSYGNDTNTQREERVPISAVPPQVIKASGPMSSSVVIPDRPKPGRKPIAGEDAVDRRRVQNRMAQRSFRDKRQQKLSDITVELEERKGDYQRAVNELERKMAIERKQKQDLASQIETLTARLHAAEARAEKAEAKLRQSQALLGSTTGYFGGVHGTLPALSVTTQQRNYGGFGVSSQPTPPEDSTFGHLEQDFTNYRQSQLSNGHRQAISNDGSAMDFTGNMSSDCGFCTDDQNCACKQPQTEAGPFPGTCTACRTDPAHAAACRDLAVAADFTPRPPGVLENSQLLDPMTGLPIPPQRVSCQQLVAGFRQHGERTASITEIYDGQLHAWPSAAGGYDVDQREAAAVLQTLASRRNTLVSPSEGRIEH